MPATSEAQTVEAQKLRDLSRELSRICDEIEELSMPERLTLVDHWLVEGFADDVLTDVGEIGRHALKLIERTKGGFNDREAELWHVFTGSDD